jgi:WD40 repeat protein
MPDVREVYEMVTKQKPSEPGALERQHTRQIRTARNRKIGGLVVAAAVIAAVAAVLSVALGGTPPDQTAGNPSQVPANPPPYSATVASTEGEILDVITGVPADASDLEFSPDGQTIAFVQQGFLWMIARDGTNSRMIDRFARATPGDAHQRLSWSPDGSQIAYVIGGDIWVGNADGSNFRQLTTEPGGDFQPAWSSQDVIAYWHGSSSGEDGGPPDA